MTLAPTCADASQIQLWRRQIARQLSRRSRAGSRAVAALGYQLRRPAVDGLIPLRDLNLYVLHDSWDVSEPRIRFAGYRASLIAEGVAFGGADRIVLQKDLALPPTRRTAREQFRLDGDELLCLALQLDRRLELFTGRPRLTRPHVPVLPPLWAALNIPEPVGAGPEYEEFQRRLHWTGGNLLRHYRRPFGAKLLYPLKFVSHLWEQFRGVYADVTTMPKRQVIHCTGPEDLAGFMDATQFDFFGSRFRAANS